MKILLCLSIATTLLTVGQSSAMPARVDMFPMHGAVAECNEDAPAPACIIIDGDGSIPGRDELEAEPQAESWIGGGAEHHVIQTPRYMTGPELRDWLRQKHNRASRNVIGWTYPDEPTWLEAMLDWFEAGRRDGGTPARYADHWWAQRYVRMPGQDEDRAETARAKTPSITEQPSERPEKLGREHYDHRNDPPSRIDPMSGKPIH
jgi:hypothetical protein